MDLLDQITSDMNTSRGGGGRPPPAKKPRTDTVQKQGTSSNAPPSAGSSASFRIPKKPRLDANIPPPPSAPFGDVKIKEECKSDQYYGNNPVQNTFRSSSGSHSDRGSSGSGDRWNSRGDRDSRGGGSYGGGDRRDDRGSGGYRDSRGGGHMGDRRDDRGSGYGGDRSSDRGDDRRRHHDNRGGNFGGDRRDSFGRDGGHRGGGHDNRGGRGGSYGGGNGYVKQEYGGGGGNAGHSGDTGLEVEMNALAIKNEREYVQRYHVDIIKNYKNRDKDMTRSFKHDQAYIAKEMMVFGIMNTLYKLYPNHFGNNRFCHAYDGGYTLYSIGCTFDKLPGGVSFSFTPEELKQSFPDCVVSNLGRFDVLKIDIKYTNDICLKGAQFYQKENLREAIKFFEVVTDCYLHEGNFLNYTTKSFEKAGNSIDIGSAKLVKKGLDKNVRLMGDDIKSAQLVLQSSSKASAFHKDESVFEYLAETFKTKDVRDVPRFLERNADDCLKATAALKNVFVNCKHTGRKFELRRISSENSANNTRFTNKNDVSITVFDYYRAQYNYVIRYPDCPLAVEVKPGGSAFYPIELLEVVEGQRVPTGMLENKLQDDVHKTARAIPADQKNNTMRQLEAAKLRRANNPFLQAFGIHVDAEFMRYQAKILAKPIRYDASGYIVQKGSHFAEPVRVTKKIAVCVLDAKKFGERQAKDFYEGLCRGASRKGIRIPSQADIFFKYAESDIRDFLKQCTKKGDYAIIFFISESKTDDSHHIVKLCEGECGQLTQQLTTATANKVASGQTATLVNVLRKFNSKLGGINESVAPNICSRESPAEVSKKLMQNRMFVGLEMVHPPAQSQFDREHNVELAQPTEIGMSFSQDSVSRLGGFSWYQRPRLHAIQFLERHFKEALEKYYSKNKRFPQEIIVYRGGGSEGEFDEITNELENMKKAVLDCCNRIGSTAVPLFVYIVVMGHSNHMILRADVERMSRNPKASNVPSGTCVDGGLTDPLHDEFILVSQEGNIGTSHPMRAVIVNNEASVPKDELIRITYALCFAHQASEMPTGRPNVLYAAGELAKRARNNWNAMMKRKNAGLLGNDGFTYDIQQGEDLDNYLQRMSIKCNSTKLTDTFWA